MAEEKSQAYGWDDTIDGTGNDYVLFEAGTYPFEVIEMKRAQFKGSDKMAASPMAKMTLRLSKQDGTTTVASYNIILNRAMKHRISEFFMGIGQIPENQGDDDWRPNWNATIGATGYCEIAHREYNGNTYMDVKKIIKPSKMTGQVIQNSVNQMAGAAPVPTQAQVATQPVAQPPVMPQAQVQQVPQVPQPQIPTVAQPSFTPGAF